jgi:hypothetical protein
MSLIFDKNYKQEGQNMQQLLIYGPYYDTSSVFLPKEARMTQMERNPLSIRHDVVSEFREFGMSSVKTAGLIKATRLRDSTFHGISMKTF